jgi:hypothetical protein
MGRTPTEEIWRRQHHGDIGRGKRWLLQPQADIGRVVSESEQGEELFRMAVASCRTNATIMMRISALISRNIAASAGTAVSANCRR